MVPLRHRNLNLASEHLWINHIYVWVQFRGWNSPDGLTQSYLNLYRACLYHVSSRPNLLHKNQKRAVVASRCKSTSPETFIPLKNKPSFLNIRSELSCLSWCFHWEISYQEWVFIHQKMQKMVIEERWTVKLGNKKYDDYDYLRLRLNLKYQALG